MIRTCNECRTDVVVTAPADNESMTMERYVCPPCRQGYKAPRTLQIGPHLVYLSALPEYIWTGQIPGFTVELIRDKPIQVGFILLGEDSYFAKGHGFTEEAAVHNCILNAIRESQKRLSKAQEQVDGLDTHRVKVFHELGVATIREAELRSFLGPNIRMKRE